MTVFSQKSKRITSFFLAILMCLSVFAVGTGTLMQTGKAADDGFTLREKNWYDIGERSRTLNNGWDHSGSSEFITMKYKATGGTVYCVQPGVPTKSGVQYTVLDNYLRDQVPNKRTSYMQKRAFIGQLVQPENKGGYAPENVGSSNQEGWCKALAVQILIWEVIVEERDANFNYVAPSGGADTVWSLFYARTDAGETYLAKAREYYNEFAERVHPPIYRPSFSGSRADNAPTIKLDKYDGANFYTTVTDTNGMLKYFNFSHSGMTFTRSGNNLTIKSPNIITENSPITISAPATSPSGAALPYGSEGAVFWQGANNEQVLCDDVTDPVPTAYFKVATTVLGQIIVHKISNNTGVSNGNSNYSLAGGQFRVTGPNGYNQVITTDSTGVAKTDKTLRMGEYTITEIKAPPGYVLDSTPKKVTVSTDSPLVNAAFTEEINYPNSPQLGVIQLQKTTTADAACEVCGEVPGDLLPLSNAVFEVRNSSGTLVDTIKTDSSGFAQTKQLPLGTYSIEEVTPAAGYLINENIPNVTLSYSNQTASVSYAQSTVAEEHQHGRITIYKQDVETGGIAQGKATLNGATFTIRDKETMELLQTLTCDADKNYVVSDPLPVGRTYVIEETNPPYGYEPTDIRYEVALDATQTNIPVVTGSTTVYNEVTRGSIKIIKSREQIVDDTKVTVPFEGVEFIATSKTTGQKYAGDKKLTDAQGVVTFSNLPFDDYTIHEVTPSGFIPLADFTVSVETEGYVYEYAVTNIATTYELIVNKVDADSGKLIPYEGAQFQLFVDENGNGTYEPDVDTQVAWQVRQEDGTLKEENTISTSKNGVAMLPKKLDAAKQYLIKEIKAPEGYVLEEDYVPCDITKGDNSNQQVLMFSFKNAPQTAQLTIYKLGEQLSSATTTTTEYGTLYTPVYKTGGLPGAKFDIIAAEDIVTPDGTVRFTKDTVVATVTTGKDGKVTCPVKLYLGHYIVVEKEAPEGFVLDETPYSVDLEYAGQNIAVITKEVQAIDERQKTEIDLKKVLENPGDDYEGDNANYEGIVFGLFAEENIQNATGAVVLPKDSLLEVLTVSADGTAKTTVDLPFGSYYVKELKTKPGYELINDIYHVEFVYQGEETKTVFIPLNGGEAIINRLQRLDLHIEKTSRENKNIANIPFEVSGTTLTGHEYKQVFYTDENGDIAISGLLVGVYTVRELSCDENKDYILPDAQEVELVTENETVSFYNQEKTGTLEIQKTFEGSVEDVNANLVVNTKPVEPDTVGPADNSASEPHDITVTTEDGKTITRYVKAGVPFHIYGVSDAGYEYDEILYTDAEGKIVITDLPIGTYTVEEIGGEWTVGYVEAGKYEYTIKDGETTSDIINNEKIRAPFDFTKTDITTGKVLPDCGVRIMDERGNVVFEGRTDENGNFKIELEYGKYTYQEFDAPDGYELDESPYPFEIKEDGTVVKAEMKDEPILTEIDITKLCYETQEPLAGAKFAIYAKGSDEALQVVVTGEDGTAKFTDLRYGDYVIKELEAPEGYVVNSETLSVTIENGFDRHLQFDFYDTPVPQTGVAGNTVSMALIAGGTAMLAASGCALGIVNRKKRNPKTK